MVFGFVIIPWSKLVSFLQTKNFEVRRSVIVLVVLSGFTITGAFYLRRKRPKDSQNGNVLNVTSEEESKQLSKQKIVSNHNLTTDGKTRRISYTSVSSSGSSVFRKTSTARSPEVSSAYLLYKLGKEECLTGIEKMEKAANIIKDDESMMDSTDGNESTSTLTLNESSSTVIMQETGCSRDVTSNNILGQSAHSRQALLDSSLADFCSMQSESDLLSCQELISIDLISKQVHSIRERVHNLPSMSSSTLSDLEETRRERNESESKSEDETMSNCSFFSTKSRWEVTSTDFAMEDPGHVASLALYEEGQKAVERNEVISKVLRTKMVQCKTDEEYLAKLYCIRLGFKEMLKDVKVREWMQKSGRLMVEMMLCAANRDCVQFRAEYNKLIDFCSDPENWELIEEELLQKVVEVNFYDVVIDYIMMGAFEKINNLPTAVLRILGSRFITEVLKEKAFSTSVFGWIVTAENLLRGKFARGFRAHLYNCYKYAVPVLGWGFFAGYESPLKTSCYRLKEEVLELSASFFNLRRIRYSSKEDMAVDLKKVMQERFKSFISFMDEKVIKDQLAAPKQ